MAGCKTWQGKLTWSFLFERVATLGERREGYCVIKKDRSAGVKELKKQNISHPGRAEYNAFCAAARGQSPHMVSSIYTLPRKGKTMKSMQSELF